MTLYPQHSTVYDIANNRNATILGVYKSLSDAVFTLPDIATLEFTETDKEKPWYFLDASGNTYLCPERLLSGIASNQGIKFDQEKLQWHLVVWEFIEAGVRVLMHGAKKYAPENWKKVEGRRIRYQDAMTRHWVAYCKGEKLDPETGESHLAHMFCNAMFLHWMDENGDDGK